MSPFKNKLIIYLIKTNLTVNLLLGADFIFWLAITPWALYNSWMMQLFKAAIIVKSYGYAQTQETKHKGFFYEPFGPAAACREDQASSQKQCDQAEEPEGLLRPSRGARLLTEGRRELIPGDERRHEQFLSDIG